MQPVGFAGTREEKSDFLTKWEFFLVIRSAMSAGLSKTMGKIISAPEGLKDCPVFALGCPAMGAEVLEEETMEGFVTAVEGFASGKKIGLFGSYGWGDGEWMRDWVQRMEDAGATVYGGEAAIYMNEPDGAEDDLKALGKELASL